MATRICKTFRFEAAHQLPQHDGKCARPHGHSYRVDVYIVGPLDVAGPKRGMVMDFADIGGVWADELEPALDHRDLNESIGADVMETTAECIAQWCYEQFTDAISGDVERVRVWETASSWAEYPA
jgi:6-pyruvoyltetrahydropterin/6-carboxytetrahydropterin synthase